MRSASNVRNDWKIRCTFLKLLDCVTKLWYIPLNSKLIFHFGQIEKLNKMKKPFHQLCKGILLSFLFMACHNTAPDSQVTQPLFNGKTFAGWEGNKDMWRIEKGAFVGGSLQSDIPNNEFLCTQMQFEDFELRLKAKMVFASREAVSNGGIQFRTKRIPNHHEVIGYQCDMGENQEGPLWGFLYDESRRNRFLAKADVVAVEQVVKKDDWNDFIIRAEGDRIQIWLNGFKTVDFMETDNSIVRSGIICVQIHSGPPAESWFKDMEIRSL